MFGGLAWQIQKLFQRILLFSLFCDKFAHHPDVGEENVFFLFSFSDFGAVEVWTNCSLCELMITRESE